DGDPQTREDVTLCPRRARGEQADADKAQPDPHVRFLETGAREHGEGEVEHDKSEHDLKKSGRRDARPGTDAANRHSNTGPPVLRSGSAERTDPDRRGPRRHSRRRPLREKAPETERAARSRARRSSEVRLEVRMRA